MDRPADWSPHTRRDTLRPVRGVEEIAGPPPARIIDLGCGDGRVLIPLARRGYSVTGVDHDGAALAACRSDASKLTVKPALIRADFTRASRRFGAKARFHAVLCLGNTLMTITDATVLRRFFRVAARFLDARGAVIIDDFPLECWREIADGNWRRGASADGSRQMVFLPGEAMFAVREGRAVNRRSWIPGPRDRVFRLWSLSELKDAAAAARLAAPEHRRSARLLAFAKER